MRDPSDVTDYSRLGPPMRLPASCVGEPYTAAQCLEKAQEAEAWLAVCIDGKMRRWYAREAAGWRKLAADGRK